MADIKRVAITVYYWPPSGGSGVQRWLFLVHYFAAQGMDVTVFVPKNPRVAQQDDALRQKVHQSITEVKVDGWEPLQHSSNPIGENLG